MGRAVIGVSRSDHDLGKVRTIGGHDAVRHKAPEAVGGDDRAYDVLAIDDERSHVLCGGSARLVHLRRVQGVDANAMPIHDKRVAIDRCGLTFNDGRLLRLAGPGKRRQDLKLRLPRAHGAPRRWASAYAASAAALLRLNAQSSGTTNELQGDTHCENVEPMARERKLWPSAA